MPAMGATPKGGDIEIGTRPFDWLRAAPSKVEGRGSGFGIRGFTRSRSIPAGYKWFQNPFSRPVLAAGRRF